MNIGRGLRAAHPPSTLRIGLSVVLLAALMQPANTLRAAEHSKAKKKTAVANTADRQAIQTSSGVVVPLIDGWKRGTGTMEEKLDSTALVCDAKDGQPAAQIFIDRKPTTELSSEFTAEMYGSLALDGLKKAFPDGSKTNVRIGGQEFAAIRVTQDNSTLFMIPFVGASKGWKITLRVDGKIRQPPENLLQVLAQARGLNPTRAAASGAEAPPITPVVASAPTVAPPSPPDREPPPPMPSAERPAARSGPVQAVTVPPRAAEKEKGTAPAVQLPLATPTELPSPLDLRTLTQRRWTEVVGTARESMRLVYGALSVAEEKRFDAAWAPMLQYPSEEVLDYFNKLNPLLTRFLAVRSALAATAEAFDDKQNEVTMLAAYKDWDGVREAMAVMQIYRQYLNSLNTQMAGIVGQIETLGDPPDARAAHKRARKHHEEMMAQVSQAINPQGATNGCWVLQWMEINSGHFIEMTQKNRGEEHAGCLTMAGETDKRTVVFRWNEPPLRLFAPDRSLWKAWIARDYESERRVSKELERPTPDDDAERRSFLKQQEVAVASHYAYYDGWILEMAQQGQAQVWYSTMELSGSGEGLQANASVKPMVVYEYDTKHDLSRMNRDAGEIRVTDDHPAVRATCPVVIPPPKADVSPKKQVLRICYSLNGPGSFVVSYYYAWDPTGTSLQPYQRSGYPKQTLARGPLAHNYQLELLRAKGLDFNGKPEPKTAAVLAKEEADAGQQRAAAEQARADAEATKVQLAFYAQEARYWDEQVAKYQQQRAAAAPGSYAQIDYQIRCAQADAQQARDMAQSLQTGEPVHTPTPWDAYNLSLQMAQSQKMAAEINERHRIIENMPKMIALAESPNERTILQDFFVRQMTEKAVASDDNERLRKVRDIIADRVMGGLQQSAAEAQDAAIQKADYCERVENVKWVCDTAVNLYALGGGNAVGMFYGGTTGFIEAQREEGFVPAVKGAVKGVLANYNTVVNLANTAMDGYMSGVLNNLEEYANDPKKGQINEVSAGVSSALWAVGKSAVESYVLGMAQKPLQAEIRFGGKAQVCRPPAPSLRGTIEAWPFIKAQSEGKAKVVAFQRSVERLNQARASGASPATIAKCKTEMRDAYKEVKTDYHAKMELNARAKTGEKDLIGQYNRLDKVYTYAVNREVARQMKQDGWGKQKLKPISNSASSGKAGMDLDLGVIEPPRYRRDPVTGDLLHVDPKSGYLMQKDCKTGRFSHVEDPATGNVLRQDPRSLELVHYDAKTGAEIRREPAPNLKDIRPQPARNPEHDAWVKSLTQNGEQRTANQYTQAGQQKLNAAYEKVFGRKPDPGFATFTTSEHPEAYRDMAWLGKKGMKGADFANVDPAWAQQAADVTGFKVNEMNNEHSSMDAFSRFQEKCRGLVKDYDTKLKPMIDKGKAKNDEPAKHLHKIMTVMRNFAENTIGPIEANDQLSALTGGQGVADAQGRFSLLFGEMVKINAAGGK